MTVVCKVGGCPYRSRLGFCRNKTLVISGAGMCRHIYDKRGQVRGDWRYKIDEIYMEQEKEELAGVARVT